jgi:hypothetical protein
MLIMSGPTCAEHSAAKPCGGARDNEPEEAVHEGAPRDEPEVTDREFVPAAECNYCEKASKGKNRRQKRKWLAIWIRSGEPKGEDREGGASKADQQ